LTRCATAFASAMAARHGFHVVRHAAGARFIIPTQ
jgi:hypothetical protein